MILEVKVPTTTLRKTMGNSGSTRKISISNDDPASIIKVSDAVARRLKGSLENSNQDESESKKRSAEVNEKELPKPQLVSGGEPSMTSLQIRQQKEAEIRNNDAYWERRIAKLQESNSRVARKLEEEYEAAIRDVNNSFPKPSSETGIPPCQDAKSNVINCYKKNPNHSLLCAKEVQAFTACVDIKRMNIIANKG